MVRVEDSEWPIVRLEFVGDVSLEDVELLTKELRGVQARLGPFVIVSDLADLHAASATARVRQAIAQAADDLAERGALRAEAVVVPHPVLRALFTGYSWLRRNANHAQKTFPDVGSALVWAQAEAGKRVPPRRMAPETQ